ncbi:MULTISPECIES: DUF4019 domain-containing protein [unclassified Caballeronia]|uniref:DUF4019 domain-containing protein n=1 Tax=unclassified Caballeronia TaxID=2646786 RepID=UPI0028573593|nr:MULTISPECIES: DUF4019 domain-containing protein [unclassified Caballeronia]MDR5740369.1 DUF4019 domain-containing protein [Caballeronia sp. LZ016]MDR5808451.1 DUF4019 domain-containing protein [Caballeronia sp. LZ019]
MNTNTKLWLSGLSLMSLLVSAGGTAQAQQTQPAPQPRPAPSLTREQQANLDKLDQDIAEAAIAIVKLIDQNKPGEVWDGASAVAKKIITREDFVNKVTRDRAALGAPGIRMPMGVKHLQFDGTGNMPAGSFMSVAFETQFSDARQSSRESVTFILDPDRRWRFVGYAVR